MSFKPTLIFIPSIYQGDTDRSVFSETLQYKWHCYLWKFFKANSLDFNVIWKAGRFNHLEDPIRYFKAPNIRYSTESLEKELKCANFALTDSPSASCVLDCAKAGVPILTVVVSSCRGIPVCTDDLCVRVCRNAKKVEWLRALVFINEFIKAEKSGNTFEFNKPDWIGKLEGDKNERKSS